MKNVSKLGILVGIGSILSIYAQEFYFIVHGTWAHHEAWAQPGGYFFETVQKSVPHAMVLPFSWSGKNDHSERCRAAEELAKLIIHLPLNVKISLIAHSHGGNVCFLASQLLEGTKRRITTLITLGTPIEHLRYQPNVKTISFVYNLFSFGDPVQTVSGTFERMLPPSPHTANITLTCNGTYPDHAGLHSPIVARWISTLPNLCQSCHNQAYGALALSNNQAPYYQPDPSLPMLIANEKKLYAALSWSFLPRKQKAPKDFIP